MEKRKIEIDINTAKEWYNSNNESLKTIALQAFTEEELAKFLPKTWEEYATYNKGKLVYYIDFNAKYDVCHLTSMENCKNSLNTKEDAEAHLALMQLHVLRDAYRDYYQKGWKPDWTSKEFKYCIVFHNQKNIISYQSGEHRFLSFPTYELAQEFLNNFKDLIEKAKDLI